MLATGLGATALVSAQRGGGPGGRRAARSRRRPSARRGSNTSDRRAPAASPPRRRSPASPASTTPAPRRAACGNPPTAAPPGSRRSTTQTSQAIGALAVAQTNPNIVWAGTGEAWAVRDMDMMGDGIYKSTDAGETWTNDGPRPRPAASAPSSSIRPTRTSCWRARSAARPVRRRSAASSAPKTAARPGSRRCSSIRTPAAPACRCRSRIRTSSSPARGRSSCRRTCSTAAAWAAASTSRSDGGKTFTKVTHPGLPKSPYGKTDVAIAPSNGNRMYALIQTGADGVKGLKSEAQGSLWRSDDGGKTWSNVSWDRRLIGRAGYYIRIRVSPDDPDHLLIANSTLWRSRDGGKIWASGGGGCGDCHDIWWDTNAVDGRPLHRHRRRRHGHLRIAEQPDRQHQRVAADRPDVSRDGRSAQPVLGLLRPAGRRQHAHRERSADRAGERAVVRACLPPPAPPPAAARCRRRRGGGAAAGGGGGGGGGGGRGGGGAARAARRRACRRANRATRIPSRTTIGSCGARATPRTSRRSTRLSGAAPLGQPVDAHARFSDPVGLKYRCQWSPPLAIDWFDNSVYFGCQVIFRTRDRGQTWEVISPGSLDRAIPSRIRFSGGVVGDNLGQFYGAVVSAIAPSRTAAGRRLGRHERRQGVDLARRRQEVERPDEEREHAAVGHRPPHRRVALRSGHGLHGGGLSPRRQPRSVPVQDRGLRPDVDAASTAALPKGHPLDYTLSIAENPHRRGHDLRRHRPRLLLFAGRRQDVDAVQGQAAGRAGELDRSAEERAGSGGRDLRPRAVDSARHLAARAGRRRPHRAGGRDLQLYKPLPGIGAPAAARATFVFSMRGGADGADHDGDPRRRRRGAQHEPGHGARRAEPGVVEPADAAPDQPVLRSIPPDNPYIWEAGRWQDRERPVTHWGLGAQRLAAARGAGQVHRAHDATTAGSTRSRSRSGAT